MGLLRPNSIGTIKNAEDIMSSRAWVRMALIFFLALVARLLDAAPHQESPTATSAIFSKDYPFIMGLGPGLAFLDDRTGWSFNIHGASQLNADLPIFVGLDAAINIWKTIKNDQSRETDSDIGIQVLPTAFYIFEVMNTRDLYPYFGISIGPNVMVRQKGAGDNLDSTTSLSLSVLFRSGLAVSLGSNSWFHFEPKFGLLGGKMLFLPQMTMAFLF